MRDDFFFIRRFGQGILFTFVICFSLLAFLAFFFTGISYPAEKTFTLTIDSKQITVNLPPKLPDVENARFGGEECFNLKVCRQQFCIPPFLPDHDHIDFVFTDKGEVIALVWTRTREAVYVVWKYVNKIPILSSIEEIKNLVINKLPKAI